MTHLSLEKPDIWKHTTLWRIANPSLCFTDKESEVLTGQPTCPGAGGPPRTPARLQLLMNPSSHTAKANNFPYNFMQQKLRSVPTISKWFQFLE